MVNLLLDVRVLWDRRRGSTGPSWGGSQVPPSPATADPGRSPGRGSHIHMEGTAAPTRPRSPQHGQCPGPTLLPKLASAAPADTSPDPPGREPPSQPRPLGSHVPQGRVACPAERHAPCGYIMNPAGEPKTPQALHKPHGYAACPTGMSSTPRLFPTPHGHVAERTVASHAPQLCHTPHGSIMHPTDKPRAPQTPHRGAGYPQLHHAPYRGATCPTAPPRAPQTCHAPHSFTVPPGGAPCPTGTSHAAPHPTER